MHIPLIPPAPRKVLRLRLMSPHLAVVLFTVIQVLLEPDASASSMSWERLPDMAVGRDYLGATVLGGTLYAIGGGISGAGASATVETFDIPSNTWSLRPAMPIANYAMGVATVGGSIYAVGGGKSFSAVLAYDPSTRSWKSRASLPENREYLAAATTGGTLYAMGGIGGPVSATYWSVLSSMDAYNPSTNSWTPRAPMLTARFDLAAASCGGTIYVFGGRSSTAAFDSVEAYDPATDTWTSRANMPAARYGLAAATVGGSIYVIGGTDGAYYWSSVFLYDPATDSWASPGIYAYPVFAPGAVGVGGDLYVISGYSPSGDVKASFKWPPPPTTATPPAAPDSTGLFDAMLNRNVFSPRHGESLTISILNGFASSGGDPINADVVTADIRIFKPSGRKIWEHVCAINIGQVTRVDWNGRSSEGALLAPGVYLVLISEEKFSKTLKVVLR